MELIVCAQDKEISEEYKTGDLLRRWEETFGYKVQYCLAAGCLEKTNIGGIKVRLESEQSCNHVVPLCEKHAITNHRIEVESYCRLMEVAAK